MISTFFAHEHHPLAYCLRSGAGGSLYRVVRGETLLLPCVSTTITAKTLPLPCVSTAITAKTLPLPCVPTAFATKDTGFALRSSGGRRGLSDLGGFARLGCLQRHRTDRRNVRSSSRSTRGEDSLFSVRLARTGLRGRRNPRAAGVSHPRGQPSARLSFCDTPSLSLLKNLLKGEGATAERQFRRRLPGAFQINMPAFSSLSSLLLSTLPSSVLRMN